MSTSPQLCAQLGTEPHPCSYARDDLVPGVPVAASAQVSAVTVGSAPPHLVDNPGGGAPCRPVDAADRLCTAPGCAEVPVPSRGGGPRRGREKGGSAAVS